MTAAIIFCYAGPLQDSRTGNLGQGASSRWIHRGSSIHRPTETGRRRSSVKRRSVPVKPDRAILWLWLWYYFLYLKWWGTNILIIKSKKLQKYYASNIFFVV